MYESTLVGQTDYSHNVSEKFKRRRFSEFQSRVSLDGQDRESPIASDFRSDSNRSPCRNFDVPDC